MPKKVELHHRQEENERFTDSVQEGESAKFQLRIVLSDDEVKFIDSKKIYGVSLSVDHRDTDSADFETITVRDSTVTYGDAFDINIVKDDIVTETMPDGKTLSIAVVNIDLKTADDDVQENIYESFGLSVREVNGEITNVTTRKGIVDNDHVKEHYAINLSGEEDSDTDDTGTGFVLDTSGFDGDKLPFDPGSGADLPDETGDFGFGTGTGTGLSTGLVPGLVYGLEPAANTAGSDAGNHGGNDGGALSLSDQFTLPQDEAAFFVFDTLEILS